MKNRVLILGGYGNAGRALAGCLRKEGFTVGIAGRRIERARAVARKLSARAHGLDAENTAQLARALSEYDVLCVASSTAKLTPSIVDAVLCTHVDYLDLWYSPTQARWFDTKRTELESTQTLFITQAGVHPGWPGAVARYVLAELDQPVGISVATSLRSDWSDRSLSASTIFELDEPPKPVAFSGGDWRGTSEPRVVDFGPDLSAEVCAPVYLPEVGALVDRFPSLTNAGAWVGSHAIRLGPVERRVCRVLGGVLPFLPSRVAKRAALGLDYWLERRCAKPPFGARLLARAWSANQTVDMMLRHHDGYFATAAAVAATLAQRRRRPNETGLVRAADWVEPQPFLSDVERMGVEVLLRRSEAACAA